MFVVIGFVTSVIASEGKSEGGKKEAETAAEESNPVRSFFRRTPQYPTSTSSPPVIQSPQLLSPIQSSSSETKESSFDTAKREFDTIKKELDTLESIKNVTVTVPKDSPSAQLTESSSEQTVTLSKDGAPVDSVTRNAQPTVAPSGDVSNRRTRAPKKGSGHPMEPVIQRMVSAAQELLSGSFRTEKRHVTFLERDSSNPSLSRMVEIVTRPNFVEIGPPKVIECIIYSDQEVIKGKLSNHDTGDTLRSNPPKHVNTEVMESLISKCNKHNEDFNRSEQKMRQIQAIRRRTASSNRFTVVSGRNLEGRNPESRNLEGRSIDSRNADYRNSDIRRFNSRSSVGGHKSRTGMVYSKPGLIKNPSIISNQGTISNPSLINVDANSTSRGVVSQVYNVTSETSAGTADAAGDDYDTTTVGDKPSSVGFFNGLAIYPGTKW